LTANTTAVTFTSALDRFDLPVFKPEWANIRRGIEKESLRVSPQGRLAQTEHPLAMGSALTHPYITTDYSDWATNCPEYKVTAVQVSPSNGPTEWQEDYNAQAAQSRRILAAE
jgi:predicted molibdopterin-dependent oxidoreductase YjgC